MTVPMIEIKDLHAGIEGKPILKGLSLTVNEGEVHAIMGPNGSGKSTLAQIIAGNPIYEIESGSICFLGQDLAQFQPHERAILGIFLSFQQPSEVPGISNLLFLRTAMNSQRKARGEEEITAPDFMSKIRKVGAELNLGVDMLKRGVNAGFSGGEKKRNEVLQMLMLDPRLAVLDEADSGLDVDALRVVARGINSLRNPKKTIILITHYQRLLDYVIPDHVHIMAHGNIVESSDSTLAHRVEKKGYGAYLS